MSATIRMMGATAEIRDSDGRWHSEDRELEEMLEALRETHEWIGADPNPALTLAQEAVDLLGGELVRYDPTETDEIEPPED
jgi:hypothetical protein